MISPLHKIIFIHIPKCAGRSISRALGEDFDHYTASYYHNNFPEHWQDYTVFTTVRNPYQRLVSMYHYIKNEPFHAAHPITNGGNIIPFADWVMENMTAFTNEFDYNSPEGNRETDREMGSPFWFSSQARRLSLHKSDELYSNIHILRYEQGMPAVESFLQQRAKVHVAIPHVNSSQSDSRDDYLRYYDYELLNTVNSFEPFANDCKVLGYKMIQ